MRNGVGSSGDSFDSEKKPSVSLAYLIIQMFYVLNLPNEIPECILIFIECMLCLGFQWLTESNARIEIGRGNHQYLH